MVGFSSIVMLVFWEYTDVIEADFFPRFLDENFGKKSKRSMKQIMQWM